jgi:hypothetical protein
MKVAFLGAGKVGAPLAAHLGAAGHEVVLASMKENSTSLGAARARSPKPRIETLPEAVRTAEVVFLATPFSANEAVLRPIASAPCGKGGPRRAEACRIRQNADRPRGHR